MRLKRLVPLLLVLLLASFLLPGCARQATPVVDVPPTGESGQPAPNPSGGTGEPQPETSQPSQTGPKSSQPTTPTTQLPAGTKPTGATQPPTTPTQPTPQTDRIIRRLEPKYATGFSIEYFQSGAKVLIDGGGQRILLLPSGVAAPTSAVYDAIITGPVQRAVALSTTQAGHFAQLGLLEQLKGVATAAEKWYIPAIKQAVESGATVNVGDDNEAVAALQPQIVFYGAAEKDAERAALLRQAGLTCVQFDDSKESHYLGRAEWLEFVAAFFNQEAKAQQLIAAGQQQIAAITSRLQAVEQRPKVLWFYYSSSGVNWNVYTNADYVSTLVSACGGSLLVPSGLTEANQSTAVKVQDEDFLGLLQQADVIIFGRSRASYPKAEDIAYFTTNTIDFTQAPAYAHNCYVVASDWFQATSEVGPILTSLSAILHPEIFQGVTLDKLTSFSPAE